jgi:hypothetical protein
MAGGAGRRLPAELLDRILRLLPLGSLRAALLVCRRWREAGEDPGLWAGLALTVGEDNQEVLVIPRLQGLRAVRLGSVATGVVEAALQHPGLREVTLEPGLDLSQADPGLLGRLVAGLRRVTMARRPDRRTSCMNYSQLKVFFGTISDSTDLRLTCLDMTHRSLASVHPAVLSGVVSGLQDASFGDVQMTEEQAKELFKVLSSGSRLKALNISSNKLTSVPCEHLTGSLSSLVTLHLAGTGLSRPQTVALLGGLSTSPHLRHLTISLTNLSAVEPRTLAATIGRLESVEMREVGLTAEQWTAVLRTIGSGESRLARMDLSNNNLSRVQPAILASALTRLEKVIMISTKLTRQQAGALVNRASFRGHFDVKLKQLRMTFNNLSKVDPASLARMASGLEKVDLGWTKIQPDHLDHIFRSLRGEKAELRELGLSGVEVGGVEPRALARGVAGLRVADLNFAHLKPSQLRALLGAIEVKFRILLCPHGGPSIHIDVPPARTAGS